ncbi:MAG TPA: ATP-binding protein [Candidatus Acidoferrum sp.]|nr:ATP-binding protein [Candidatus Acidoferrum sp.]
MTNKIHTGSLEVQSSGTALSLSLLAVAIVAVYVANLWRPSFSEGAVNFEHALTSNPFSFAGTFVLTSIGLACALGAVLVLLRSQSRLATANVDLNHELKLLIQESISSREELDRYFTLSIDMLCILGFDGFFKRLNPAWEKTLGYSIEELLKIPRIDLVHPEDRAATINEIRNLRAGRNTVWFENRYRRKDGSYVWLSWSATALPDKQQMYAVARDVTDLKATEIALRGAKEEAERSNRFKDQFLSTMSHELRTPLNAVVGFSELLMDDKHGPLTERQQRYVKHIRTGGFHLLKLINDILDLSKIEAGRLQLSTLTLDVSECFKDAVETLCPLAETKKITIRQGETDLTVTADETRFKQILMNLLGNAIKFTPSNGLIQLDAHAVDDFVRIDVRDSGPGIPPGEEQRIFEAFYRTNQWGNTVEGSGLGLAITRRLVELQGGQISVESRPNEGCVFSFTLPKGLIRPSTTTCRTATPAFGTIVASSKNDGYVLIVEDDGATREFLRDFLSKHGLNARAVATVPEARRLLSLSPPDLIVLDLILPGESGMQMLSELRNDNRDRDIPVLILTSKDLTLSEQNFLRQNANSVVRKDGAWHETLLDQMRRLPQSRLMITEA